MGTYLITQNETIIEGTHGDLWHLVTEGVVTGTYRKIEEGPWKIMGDKDFFTEEEWLQLLSYEPYLRKQNQSSLLEGYQLLLEWSFAKSVDNLGVPFGPSELIFYEYRVF